MVDEAKPAKKPRERTPAEKELLKKAVGEAWPLIETPEQRAAADAEVLKDLRAGCQATCTPEQHEVSGRVVGPAGVGQTHLQLVAVCEGCGGRATRDYVVKD